MRIKVTCVVLIACALSICGCDNSSDNSAGADSAATGATNGQDPPLPVAATTGRGRITPKKLHAMLKEKNPEYTGSAEIAPPDGEIKAVSLRDTKVTDLTPLAGLKLESLDLFQTKVADLTPLKGMPLEGLMADETAVTDLSPLKGMPLKTLWLNATAVTDISPLEGMPLEQLNLFGTKVKDLAAVQSLSGSLKTLWLRNIPAEDFSPLGGLSLQSLDVQGTAFGDEDLTLIKQMPVQRLNISQTQVTDLTPLEKLRLTRLIFTPSRIKRGLDVVRGMNSLRELDVTFREPQRLQPAQFWARYEAGTFRTPSN